MCLVVLLGALGRSLLVGSRIDLSPGAGEPAAIAVGIGIAAGTVADGGRAVMSRLLGVVSVSDQPVEG